MKKTIVNLMLSVLFLMACGSTGLAQSGSLPPPPYCPPHCICN